MNTDENNTMIEVNDSLEQAISDQGPQERVEVIADFEELTSSAKFACKLCGRLYASAGSLDAHTLRKHSENNYQSEYTYKPKSTTCTVCNQKFSCKATMMIHMRKHTGLKPYICTREGCPRKFTTLVQLQVHERIHTGEKPYQCSTCDSAFTNKSGLNRHELVHTGVKPFPCPQCGKFFTQKGSVRLHIRTVHDKLPPLYKRSRKKKNSTKKEKSSTVNGNGEQSDTTDEEQNVLV